MPRLSCQARACIFETAVQGSGWQCVQRYVPLADHDPGDWLGAARAGTRRGARRQTPRAHGLRRRRDDGNCVCWRPGSTVPFEHRPYGPVQGRGFPPVERVGRPERVYPGVEEGFVGVHIADAGDMLLVQQRRLNGR